MKISTYIFTFYMLTLSLVPCGDGGGGIVELIKHLNGIEHHHVSDHQQHSKGCGDDTCTPFCVCNCCSMTINVPTIANLTEVPLKFISGTTLAYNSNFYPSGYLSSIWQPPKFS